MEELHVTVGTDCGTLSPEMKISIKAATYNIIMLFICQRTITMKRNLNVWTLLF